MSKVIIATLFKKEPVLTSVTKLGADDLYLIIDNNPNKKQNESLSLIKKTLKNVVNINTIKVSLYDIASTSEIIVNLLDKLSLSDNITLNISSGRKPQSLALLFAAYSRINYVNKIIYVTEEDNSIIELPKFSFNLNDNQKKLIIEIKKGKELTSIELAKKIKVSRAMLYRYIKELNNLGLIVLDKNSSKYKLTDAGKIAIL